MGWDKALYFAKGVARNLFKAEGATVIGATGETMKASTQGQKEGAQVAPQDAQRRSAVYRELESYVSCIRREKSSGRCSSRTKRRGVCAVRHQAMEEGRVVKI